MDGPDGLRARCDTCRGRDRCARDGLREQYPLCHQAVRRTKIDRLVELLHACARPHGGESGSFASVVATVAAHHAVDREHYSEIVELSASRVGESEQLFRFSYALPGFREQPLHAATLGRGLLGPYGDVARRIFDHALALACDRAVALPLVGLEDSGSGRFRAKVYLQFEREAGAAAIALAAQLFGAPGWERRFGGRALHMIGVDVGPGGSLAAKLYFDVAPLSLGAPWLRASGLVEDLRRMGVQELRDVLAIHSFGSPDDARGDEPSQIDFGLAANELPWARVRALERFALATPPSLEALERSFRVAVRRVSINAATDDKLTAYYILAEEEASPPDVSPDPSEASSGRPRIVRARRQLESIVRRMLGPLLQARPGPSGWRVLSWDAEQGVSIVFQRGGRYVLVELEPRDEAQDCYARTRRFNVCARSQFTPDGALRQEERALVEGVVRLVAGRENLIELDESLVSDASQVREILVDRVLMPEGAGRYYLNAYAGCMIGCAFCYVAPRAQLSRRLERAPAPPWGRWVDVKVNAAEVLRQEVREHHPGLVRMSPILTDPYQPIERRYRITRQCVEILLEAGFGAAILTRESRVLEDLPLLRRGRAAVGFSIPTDDDALRRVFEPRADTIENRLEALRRCSEAGVATCLVVQPALPMNVDTFVQRTAPWTRVVRIDRMHFSERVTPLYEAAGISYAASPAYEEELVGRLREGFTRAGVAIDDRDDLAAMIDALISPEGGWGPPARAKESLAAKE